MKSNIYPLIYTVIVTFNGERWIRNCLTRLAESRLPVYTIVVDNASEDNTTNIIINEFTGIELIRNDENKGFGSANNTAIHIAMQRNADYVFLLNQDAFVQEDTLDQMIGLFEKHKDYGIISPVQLNGSGAALDANFRKYLSRVLNNKDMADIEQGKKLKAGVIPVRFVNAAAWLISAEIIKKVGMFHPLFFHYGEDNNYSSRVQYHGYKIGIATNAYVWHDRAIHSNKQKELLRKINTVIRYTATDPRKTFGAAYLQAWYKYFILWKKSRGNAPLYSNALKTERKFLLNLEVLKTVRKQMKQQA